jgi:hypothetical protein
MMRLRVFKNFYTVVLFFDIIVLLFFHRKVEKSSKRLPCCMCVCAAPASQPLSRYTIGGYLNAMLYDIYAQ